MASHTPGDRGSRDALPQAALVLPTDNRTPPSGHNNTQGSSGFQRETSQRSKSTSPVGEIQLAAVARGGWKDQIRQPQQQNTASRALCCPPFAGRSLCGRDPVGPMALFSLGWSVWCVLFIIMWNKRGWWAQYWVKPQEHHLCCVNFWKVLGLNLWGTESACLRWDGATQRFSPLVSLIPAGSSVESFVRLKDFKVQERDKCL